MPMLNPRITQRETAYLAGADPYTHPADIASLPLAVPRNWIQVSDEFILDSILADGKPKMFHNVLTINITEKGQVYPVTWEKYVRKTKNGYDVASYDDHQEYWHIWHFKDLLDLLTNPKSIIGNAMFAFSQSRLFYEPDRGEVKIRIPGINAPVEKIEPPPPLVFPPLDSVLRGRKSKNPRFLSSRPRQIKGTVIILRSRRFNQHYGLVNLALLKNNANGNYAVWSDASNTIGGGKMDAIYGYPAVFDIRYYEHQSDALNDYWHRREQRTPVPLKEK